MSQKSATRKRPVKKKASKRDPFPWVALLVFLASIYLFWFLPRDLHPKPVDVSFSKTAPG